MFLVKFWISPCLKLSIDQDVRSRTCPQRTVDQESHSRYCADKECVMRSARKDFIKMICTLDELWDSWTGKCPYLTPAPDSKIIEGKVRSSINAAIDFKDFGVHITTEEVKIFDKIRIGRATSWRRAFPTSIS